MPKLIAKAVVDEIVRLLKEGNSDRAVSDLLAEQGIKVSSPTVGSIREKKRIRTPVVSRRVPPKQHKQHKQHAGTKFSPLRAEVVRIKTEEPRISWRDLGKRVGCTGENARQLWETRDK